ncbi:TylF/MycF family methyltransferase [Pedobacter sp. MC2016-14]|uniref:TylF/MycF/NovP-related O-methyltransferase n=1 Tax=Pedobacter sp. MC2016-14 TaxID=2897327 RepID=UPI001E313270|nr:TylF/MycF/NovP-related O-methyltransferase [Pedobacter sp. MC2016-14]MCD0486926.1 TylF/MycF family methyltransferase [Pedobacter sp. MC2016-14]
MDSQKMAPSTGNELRVSYIQLLRDCVSYWLWLPSDKKMKRFMGEDCPKDGLGETMIGIRRLDNIHYCLKQILEQDIPGDVIETGVWRGGAVIFMKGILHAYGDQQRKVWVADSFQGVPAPDEVNYAADAGVNLHEMKILSIPKSVVVDNFKKYNLLDHKVKFLEGWFKDTLHTEEIKQLSLLRLDGDLYESSYQALEALYPKLSVGGYCIVDDYLSFECCKQAVDDYRAKMNITDPIVQIDNIAVFWRKES